MTAATASATLLLQHRIFLHIVQTCCLVTEPVHINSNRVCINASTAQHLLDAFAEPCTCLEGAATVAPQDCGGAAPRHPESTRTLSCNPNDQLHPVTKTQFQACCNSACMQLFLPLCGAAAACWWLWSQCDGAAEFQLHAVHAANDLMRRAQHQGAVYAGAGTREARTVATAIQRASAPRRRGACAGATLCHAVDACGLSPCCAT